MSSKLLSVEEAAKYLGMSPSWLRSSRIRSVKLGRRRLYRPADLDQFVSERVRR